MTDKEIHYRIVKAVELEREALKAMGIPLVQWDDDLGCITKIMPDGKVVPIKKGEVINGNK